MPHTINTIEMAGIFMIFIDYILLILIDSPDSRIHFSTLNQKEGPTPNPKGVDPLVSAFPKIGVAHQFRFDGLDQRVDQFIGV
jgi:hypothetical protein